MPLAWLVIAIVAFGSFFGLLLPPIFAKHTADWLDVVAYTLGALVLQSSTSLHSKQLSGASLYLAIPPAGYSRKVYFF